MKSKEQMIDVKISSSVSDLHIDEIHSMLTKAFWSPGIMKEEIQKGISNSALVVGAYLPNGTQVGFLRAISDKTRFAYICDVIVDEHFRKKGICQKMVNYALSSPELKDVYQWLLMTKDAHGIYSKCGFQAIRNPGSLMSIFHPRQGRTLCEM